RMGGAGPPALAQSSGSRGRSPGKLRTWNSDRTGSISTAELTMRIVGSVVMGGPLLGYVGRLVLPGHVGAADLHGAARARHGVKTVPLVEAVGVAGAEQAPTQAPQGGVAHDALDQPLRQPPTPVLLQDEHVAEPGEGRPVGHDAGQADLPL